MRLRADIHFGILKKCLPDLKATEMTVEVKDKDPVESLLEDIANRRVGPPSKGTIQ